MNRQASTALLSARLGMLQISFFFANGMIFIKIFEGFFGGIIIQEHTEYRSNKCCLTNDDTPENPTKRKLHGCKNSYRYQDQRSGNNQYDRPRLHFFFLSYKN